MFDCDNCQGSSVREIRSPVSSEHEVLKWQLAISPAEKGYTCSLQVALYPELPNEPDEDQDHRLGLLVYPVRDLAISQQQLQKNVNVSRIGTFLSP